MVGLIISKENPCLNGFTEVSDYQKCDIILKKNHSMPTSLEYNSADSTNIYDWINLNTSDKNSINACIDESFRVPSEKGIYLWYIHPKGYDALSNYIKLTPLNNCLTRKIDESLYDLVYVGTAGVRNNTSGVNNGHLRGRLRWHLCNIHSNTAIKSGTISTLRKTLTALISDDLLLNSVQLELNNIFRKWFKVYWIVYPGTFEHVKECVSEDESILIKYLRPIFNLKNNLNISEKGHLSSFIQQRRMMIEKNTLNRLSKITDTLSASNSNKSGVDASVSIIKNKEINCVSFVVGQSQLAHEVIGLMRELPKGPCIITIVNNKSKSISIYSSKHGDGSRKIRESGRSVADYFRAPDTVYKDGKLTKSKVLQEIMVAKNIQEVEITICKMDDIKSSNGPDHISLDPRLPNNPPIKIVKNAMIDTKDLSSQFKLVFMCSNSKKSNSAIMLNNDEIKFFAKGNEKKLEFLPDDLIPKKFISHITENFIELKLSDNISWRDLLVLNHLSANPLKLKCAFDLYDRNYNGKSVYAYLNNTYKHRFYILSAGWGLVNTGFHLPNYNITFSPNAKGQFSFRDGIDEFSDFNALSEIDDNEDIVFIGSPDYLTLFYNCTKHLSNRKIIFWKKQNTPTLFLPPNQTFHFVYYETENSIAWHYELATKKF